MTASRRTPYCRQTLTALLAMVLLVAAPAEAAERSGFKVKRGTNISHWLSQSRNRGADRRNWFTREDVAFLAGLGFDHLRIPIDEEQMWDESGKPEAEAFALLNQALDWCADYKLNAIVDLHILRSHHFNEKERPLWTKPEAQERFFQCWRELSDALHNRPVESVAYELMNEPVADNPEDWNKLVAKAVAVVRAKEPKRVIVVGSNKWQSADTFDQLKVPEGDPNILLSFHFYEPFSLTHHTAGWTSIGGYKGPVKISRSDRGGGRPGRCAGFIGGGDSSPDEQLGQGQDRGEHLQTPGLGPEDGVASLLWRVGVPARRAP